MNPQEATMQRAGVPRQAFAVIARLDADDDRPAASGPEIIRIVEGTGQVSTCAALNPGGDPM
jgi:hypothetical protein